MECLYATDFFLAPDQQLAQIQRSRDIHTHFPLVTYREVELLTLAHLNTYAKFRALGGTWTS